MKIKRVYPDTTGEIFYAVEVPTPNGDTAIVKMSVEDYEKHIEDGTMPDIN